LPRALETVAILTAVGRSDTRGRSRWRRAGAVADSVRRAIRAARARLVANQPSRLRVDPLTGALSAQGFIDAFERTTDAIDGDRPGRLGLISVNIDQASGTRDLFGLEMGALMLSTAYSRIRSATGRQLTVGRAFGDEFLVLAPYTQTETVANRIVEVLDAPAIADGVPLDLTGPIGIALRPEHGVNLVTLVPAAQEAAHTARQAGIAVGVYEPRTVSEVPQRLELVRELQQSLTDPARHNEIQVLYQPQVAVASGALDKVEALLRWKHPRLGEINAQNIIDTVEPTALMHTLTRRIIDDVAAQLAAWTAEGVRIRAAINVSMRDVTHHDSVVDRVTQALRRFGVPPGQVELEVTEGALVSDETRASEVVAQLAAAGIPVLVDDFGTGYASLLYVRSLPVAGLKIDRGIVQRIAVNDQDRTIVRTIVEMGKALGLQVVAEGVEDRATHDVLVELRCPTAQGWFYAPPMPPAELLPWLRDAVAASPPR
jgi:diguanylate cyclase (GGDEF)-like protein